MSSSNKSINGEKLAEFLDMYKRFLDGKDFHSMDVFEAAMAVIYEAKDNMQSLTAHIQKYDQAMKGNDELADLQCKLVEARTMESSQIAERKRRSQTGSMKAKVSRERAMSWLNEQLRENPKLSINRLAALLEARSKEDDNLFHRVIPESTAKAYARACKKNLERG